MYKMYLIKEYPLKIKVVCDKCSQKGYIDKNCYSCHGKGIHNKTFMVWKIKEKKVIIDKINRDSKTKQLKYWTDLSCFYIDEDRLIHFTINDANKECHKRNVQKYGIEFAKQYLK